MRTLLRHSVFSVYAPFLLCLLCGFLAATAFAQEAPPKVAGTDVPPPKRKRLVLPEYPPEAQEKGQHGIVILELTIDTEGKVADVRMVRSIPPFDEAAIAAVKQWEYEVTRLDGKPVRVLLTVPITFALRVPEVSRQEGVPELRAGSSPLYPKGGQGAGRVVLDVTLTPQGQIADAEIVDGESPFREALLRAVRTWRFAPPEAGLLVSFRIEAEFEPARRDVPERVAIRLAGLRTTQAQAPSEAELQPPQAAPDAPAPRPQPTPPTPTPMPEPSAPLAAPSPRQTPAPPAAPPITPPAPPMEVLSVPPPRPPAPTPVAGSSAVENVTLGVGVPDLAQGRRPVAPPLARMAAAAGAVEVRFAVNAAGQTALLSVEGPPLLKPAAQSAVSSWTFRRTTAERLYLTAVFTYQGDTASAAVTPTPEAVQAPAAPAPSPEPTPAPEPPPAPSPNAV